MSHIFAFFSSRTHNHLFGVSNTSKAAYHEAASDEEEDNCTSEHCQHDDQDGLKPFVLDIKGVDVVVFTCDNVAFGRGGTENRDWDQEAVCHEGDSSTSVKHATKFLHAVLVWFLVAGTQNTSKDVGDRQNETGRET